MNKFLKESEKKFFEDTQKYVREKLTFQLGECLKENEYEFKAKNNQPLTFIESTSSLCYTIEAIFLHGLKDTFLQLLSNIGSDDHKPSPSFWKFVQQFLHKQDIKEIQSYPQLSTEIGYCRAFVRKALNDSLLSSYLQNIRKSPKSLKSYYHNYAFLYDTELSETAENLLQGFESLVIFELPCNSSLLNSWQDKSLELSGLYTPPMKTMQLPMGEDVVASLLSTAVSANLDIPQQRNTIQDIFIPSISNSIFSQSSVESYTANDPLGDSRFTKLMAQIESTSEYALEKLLQKDEDEMTDNQEVASPLTENEERMQISQEDATPENENRIGNALDVASTSWSDPIQEKTEQSEEEPDEQALRHRQVNKVNSVAIDNHSFESLWNEKQRISSLNFRELWDKFEKTLDDKRKQSNVMGIPEEDESLDFEVIKSPLQDQANLNDLQEMVEILCRISTECGLDAQGFVCKGCKSPLIEISKATVCRFDAFYYCSGCISNDKFAIPAKIIYNWDFTQYHVSKRAADFFADHQFKPFIDFKILNPDIYSYIDEMNKLQKLRIQLNFIRAYIFTCSESIIAELQKLLYGKEYIYESIHLYSVADLYLIQNGALEDLFKRVVTIGIEHCLKCALCKEKGYHCEYCRKSKIIYPFEVDDVMRCNQCGSVSHLKCYNPQIPCPKCERKARRAISAVLEKES